MAAVANGTAFSLPGFGGREISDRYRTLPQALRGTSFSCRFCKEARGKDTARQADSRVGAWLLPVIAACFAASRSSRPQRSPKTSTRFRSAVPRSVVNEVSSMHSQAAGLTGVREVPHSDDLILTVAKGERGCRTPVWLMRQAGRYMKAFRHYSERFPFRQRSETPEMAVELSLQCWRQYGMDGVIFFSDILTPLPALGIEFDIVAGEGPVVIGDLAQTLEDVLASDKGIDEFVDHNQFQSTHSFVRKTIQDLKRETEGRCTLLGFVGSPWTLAAYAVEGGKTKEAALFKRWMYEKPAVAHEFLRRLTSSIASYAIFQVTSGAQCIQIFDSWAHCLSPDQWLKFSAPYVKQVAVAVRAAHPEVPMIYFANGGSSWLQLQTEHLRDYVDVLGIDQRVTMSDASRMVEGSGLVLQGNVDPYVLRFGSETEVRDAVRRTIDDAGGPGKHILNLGHGVLQGTPEENVGHFVDEAQNYRT